MDGTIGGNIEQESDSKLIGMAIDGTLSRNKHYDFSRTERGQAIFKKAKIIKGILDDLGKGATITETKVVEHQTMLSIENDSTKYKRTIYLDLAMFDILKNLKIIE